MTRNLLLVALLLFSWRHVNAQPTSQFTTDTLRIHLKIVEPVHDGDKLKSLAGITVQLQFGGAILFTDTANERGEFVFAVNLSDSNAYTIVISGKDYVSKSIRIAPVDRQAIPPNKAFEISVEVQMHRQQPDSEEPVIAGTIIYNVITGEFEKADRR